MNLPPGIEKLWTGLVPIALPVWVTGFVILLGKPAALYNFLELQPIRDRWGSWTGVLTPLLLHFLVFSSTSGRAGNSGSIVCGDALSRSDRDI